MHPKVQLLVRQFQHRSARSSHINRLLERRDGDAVTLTSTGAPLGLLPPGLPFGSPTVPLEPGDWLVCCSDGVTDAQNAAGDEFGEAG